jgi:hypothetical protein
MSIFHNVFQGFGTLLTGGYQIPYITDTAEERTAADRYEKVCLGIAAYIGTFV